MKQVDIVVLDASVNGGIESFSKRLCDVYLECGIPARVISLFYQGDIRKKPDEINVINPNAAQSTGVLGFVKSIWQLRKITQNSVIIHTFNNIFFLSALMDFRSLKRVIYTEHSSYDAVRPHVRLILTVLLRFCHGLVCQTEYSLQKYQRVHKKNLVKLPPAYLDRAAFAPPQISKGLQIAFVGRLEHSKGVRDFLELSRALVALDRQITVHIFGEGNLETEVRTFCDYQQMQGRAVFHGYQDAWFREVPNLDYLFVLSQSESFSIVGIEAAAIGSALVMYDDLIGPKDYVSNKTSIQVPRSESNLNVRELYQKMITLRREANCVNDCIQSVQHFSKASFSNDWKAIISDV